jgi:outer membrane protein TolC
VRVVQARTSLLQNQRARLDLLNEVAQSAAALTGTTGIPIAAVLQIPE